MGAKIFYKNERSQVHFKSSKRVIHLQNWRMLGETKREDIDGVLCTLFNFRTYHLPGISISDFHRLNNENAVLTDFPFWYSSNYLSCNICHGTGKVDWITKLTGTRQYKLPTYNYKRSKRGPVYMTTRFGSLFHISTAQLIKGEEHCPQCHGCGLFVVKGIILEKVNL